eukprot:5042382-Karenia_brevis.AAC.1
MDRVQKGDRLYVLFVDLRTAFPSLNRAILLWKMMKCGCCLGMCRLVLAIFDLTVGLPLVSNLLGNPFPESRGVREGAVESPHLFNMYMSDLRQHLERNHPRLCKLAWLTIAVILYADDAVLPADGPEDLQLLADLFQEFCNSNHLVIAVPKCFLMVFHSSIDSGVAYQSGKVFADGIEVDIRFYDEQVSAVETF